MNTQLTPLVGTSSPHEQLPTKKYFTGGTLSLILLIVAWVGQAEISKSLQHGSSTHAKYNKPFFITILNQSMMTFGFLFNLFFLTKKEFVHPVQYLHQHGLRLNYFVQRCVVLGTVYCSSTYFWFKSMGDPSTSVSISSGIYNSSVVWVFLLSLLFRLETFAWLKLLGVVFAVVGVCLSSVSSASSPSLAPSPASTSLATLASLSSTTLTFQFGYLMVAGSAFLYATFEVFLKLTTNASQLRARLKIDEVPIGVANMFTGELFCLPSNTFIYITINLTFFFFMDFCFSFLCLFFSLLFFKQTQQVVLV